MRYKTAAEIADQDQDWIDELAAEITAECESGTDWALDWVMSDIYEDDDIHNIIYQLANGNPLAIEQAQQRIEQATQDKATEIYHAGYTSIQAAHQAETREAARAAQWCRDNGFLKAA